MNMRDYSALHNRQRQLTEQRFHHRIEERNAIFIYVHVFILFLYRMYVCIDFNKKDTIHDYPRDHG